MDIKNIEKNYERMSDLEIIRIATTDSHGLRPEVFGIIENEIKKRNLNTDLLKGAHAQNKDFSIEEIDTYSNLLRDLPCPICGQTDKKLNGTISYTVKSFIVLTFSSSELTIACPDCLDKKNNDALLTTILLGWWGFPEGLFKTPIYIHKNLSFKKENRLEISNSTLLSFTLDKIGEIETYKSDRENLIRIIQPDED